MFYPKHCWEPTPSIQCHRKDGKHQETHLYSNIKISLPKPISSPEVFIKCRKESSEGYPLLQNHLSSYPNTSKGICWAVHHIPALVTLLCSQPYAHPNMRFSSKLCLSKPAQNTLSFASFLTTSIAFQSLCLPMFISLLFLLTMCHTVLCLHAWITHWPAGAVVIYPHPTNKK